MVVRVVLFDKERKRQDMGMVECLRYAGLLVVHRDDDEGVCFDILPPNNAQSERWAKMNAERMASFGYNAVAAPAWETT
jgi:hypothetical protein